MPDKDFNQEELVHEEEVVSSEDSNFWTRKRWVGVLAAAAATAVIVPLAVFLLTFGTKSKATTQPQDKEEAVPEETTITPDEESTTADLLQDYKDWLKEQQEQVQQKLEELQEALNPGARY